MKPEELSGAVATAQLLANSIGQRVAVYSRTLCTVDTVREWKLLLASDPVPQGFKHERDVEPQKAKEPSAGL